MSYLVIFIFLLVINLYVFTSIFGACWSFLTTRFHQSGWYFASGRGSPGPTSTRTLQVEHDPIKLKWATGCKLREWMSFKRFSNGPLAPPASRPPFFRIIYSFSETCAVPASSKDWKARQAIAAATMVDTTAFSRSLQQLIFLLLWLKNIRGHRSQLSKSSADNLFHLSNSQGRPLQRLLNGAAANIIMIKVHCNISGLPLKLELCRTLQRRRSLASGAVLVELRPLSCGAVKTLRSSNC